MPKNIGLRIASLGMLLIVFMTHVAASAVEDDWEKYATAGDAGFSSGKLAAAYEYWKTLRPDAGATMVIYKGKVLVEWGEISYKFKCHSVRKSFLSALYGIYKGSGKIDLKKTMAELNIDDEPALTPTEKSARVIHLLKARSGIYHAAAYETPGMRAKRPERGSHAPDTFWYYNNWDFNALGTIFRQETGEDIFEAFKKDIADPIGMQDFQVSDGSYFLEAQYSIHPAYPFRMTARDRARFGQLFLNNGSWKGKQLIPENWVSVSTSTFSNASEGDDPPGIGYGYMWWVFEEDMFNYVSRFGLNELRGLSAFTASGYRGHKIMIIPEEEIVFVMCVNTDLGSLNVEVTTGDSLTLLNHILGAKKFETIDLQALKVNVKPNSVGRGGSFNVTAGVKNLGRKKSKKTDVKFYLSRDNSLSKSDKLLGTATLKRIGHGNEKTVRALLQLPTKTTPRKYFVIAVVDENDLNVDPHKDNNRVVCSLTVSR